MLLRKKKKFNHSENLITNESIYLNRRRLIGGFASMALLYSYKGLHSKNITYNSMKEIISDRPLTNYKTVTKYNNFFEFGTTKQIWKSAQKLNIEDWNINIIGGKYHKKTFDYDSLVKKFDIVERVYKFRCVEAWSMVIPWQGFQLSKLIDFLEPESDKKYVMFKTFYRPDQATNQKQSWYPWPYQEIISIEEARNILSLVATGVYGKNLPKQNGAPLRLILPWKYGFKSIKSISQIIFLKEREKSFWETIAPKEYGFWANVNPNIPHQRWSQKTEKDVETGKKYKTKLFNGYEEWVSYLYKGIKNENLFI